VVKLEGKAVDNEIARILGGASISDTTLKYAKELLQNARKFKKSACI
jgi:DNA repair ATPase RecN